MVTLKTRNFLNCRAIVCPRLNCHVTIKRQIDKVRKGLLHNLQANNFGTKTSPCLFAFCVSALVSPTKRN